MPRTARLDAPGTLHHVIVRGIERQEIIDYNEDRNSFEKRISHRVDFQQSEGTNQSKEATMPRFQE